MHYTLSKGNVSTMDLKFLVPGNTVMEVGSMHSGIEKSKEYQRVNIPEDWYNIQSERRQNPYSVIPLEYNSFMSFRS